MGIQSSMKKSSTSMESVLVGVELIALLACFPYIGLAKKAEEISLFFNFLFQFDSMYPITVSELTRMSVRVKMSIVLVYCSLITAFVLPIGYVHGLYWRNPCKAGLVGYWLIPECWRTAENCVISMKSFNMLAKCLILALNHWLYSYSLHATVFGVAGIHTFGVIAIHQFIQR